MARLIFSSIASLDGYTVDAEGRFDWAAPDEEVHAFVNDEERPVGTYLYGRAMYDTMRFWETGGDGPDDSPASRDYATLWRAAEKVVYSTTLDAVTTARTRLERAFDPGEVRRFVDSAEQDVTIGGPGLAAHALRAGVVDEVRLFLHPVAVGGGTPALPHGARTPLRLLDQRRFTGGVVFLRYAVA